MVARELRGHSYYRSSMMCQRRCRPWGRTPGEESMASVIAAATSPDIPSSPQQVEGAE